MKVIFLDVDGVLTHDLYKGTKENKGIDPEKLKLLKKLIEKTQAKIVLSSTWRRIYDKQGNEKNNELYYTLVNELQKYGLEIYSEIPRECPDKKVKRISISIMELAKEQSYDNDRAKFIIEWLEKNKQVESFVIIDDFGGWKKYKLEEFVVKTSKYNGGLQKEHVEKSIEKLNKPKQRKR